jgi:hypothetical protein
VVIADPVNSASGVYLHTYDETGRRMVRLSEFRGVARAAKEL